MTRAIPRVIVGLLATLVGTLSTGAAAQTTRPATAPAIPVVYAPYLEPQVLTDSQYKELRDIAADRSPPGTGIWFLYVRSNDGERYAADAYYTPERKDARIQRGHRLCINHQFPVPFDDDPSDDPDMLPYVQIMDETGSAPDPTRNWDFPFMPLDGMTDEHLIALSEALAASRPDLRALREGPMPVERIEGTADEPIVYLGWQVTGWAGHGCVVHLKWTGEAYQLAEEVGLWRS